MAAPFLSYARNGEDVVLWRALHGVTHGRYVEVGANHPCFASVGMAFSTRGWTGITVEPDQATRCLDGILREAHWAGQDIHFMSVHTEGSERAVLEGIDLTVWRPWVLVVGATATISTRSTRPLWEDLVLEAGYRFCLFDGLSGFYVAEERNFQLGEALSYPACALDNYTALAQRQCEDRVARSESLAEERAAEIRTLVEEVVRWRGRAIAGWATAISHSTEGSAGGEAQALRERVAELEASTSWRVTGPLRSASGLLQRARRHLRPS